MTVSSDSAGTEPPATGLPATEPPAALTDRKSRDNQAFWTVAVGAPAIFSVLRLWVEAGGDLQTTLLLVENIGPVNLVTSLFVTASNVVSAGLVTVFALGTVLSVTAKDQRRGRANRTDESNTMPLLARWRVAAPTWLVVGSFVIALVSWKILYLPILAPALVATFQRDLLSKRRPWLHVLGVALLGAYFWLVFPTLISAWRQGSVLPFVLMAAPPLLAPFVTGPVPATLTRLSPFVSLLLLALLMWAALPILQAPVLSETVTTVRLPVGGTANTSSTVADSGTADSGSTEDISGHVITVNDVDTVILRDGGGVQYVLNGNITEQVLCPTEEELPRYRLRVHGYHVEDSLLGAFGRKVRPAVPLDVACHSQIK